MREIWEIKKGCTDSEILANTISLYQLNNIPGNTLCDQIFLGNLY